jgi:hypothetical protein
MDTKLGIALKQQMDVIGHDFHAHEFRMVLLAHVPYDLLEPFVYPVYKYLASKLGTKDHMVLARIIDIAV